MAIALITNTAATTGLGPITTAGIDTTGATLLVLQIACDDAYNQTPTDSKTNTWAQLTSYTQTNVRVRTWYSIPTSVGAAHTFTFPGASAVVGTVLASAWSGTNTASVTDQVNGANGFVLTIQPGSITPSENNCLILSHLGISGSGTPISINSGFTELGEANFGAGDHYGGCFAYLIQTSAAAVNPTWTRTNTDGCATTQSSWKAAASASQPFSGKKFLQLTGAGT